MYVSIVYEAMQDAIVIIGTLLLDSIFVVVLFDSCRTHNLIGLTFVPRVLIRLEDLGHSLAVTFPTRSVLTL